MKGSKSLRKYFTHPDDTRILDKIINGSKVGTIVWNHRTSPALAPATLVLGFNRDKIRNTIAKARNKRSFICGVLKGIWPRCTGGCKLSYLCLAANYMYEIDIAIITDAALFDFEWGCGIMSTDIIPALIFVCAADSLLRKITLGGFIYE